MVPEYRRADIRGGTYFFTVNTFRHQRFLTTPCVRLCLRETIVRARRTRPFRIDAWVLLPNPLHCIWTLPPEDVDFSSRWGLIKRLVSQQCKDTTAFRQRNWALKAQAKRDRHLATAIWEHALRDPEDFNRQVDYIHWNPVKPGHVQRVGEWPYSTFHRYVARGVCPPDWGGDEVTGLDASDFGE